MNDRQIAFKILNKIEKDKAYSNLILDSYLKEFESEVFSSSFISALVYGVTERLLTLDYEMSLYLKQPVKKLKPEVKTILRMGAYQILFMDSVPESAAVNESVKLTKKNGCSFASGLVNSVLRRIGENGLKIPETDNEIYNLSIKYSCPETLVKKFSDDYGIENAKGIIESSLGKPRIFAHVNTLKTDVDSLLLSLKTSGVDAVKSDFCENQIEFIKQGSIESLQQFKDGLFHIQDNSSALCVKKLQLGENMTLVDVCAAPGGKTYTAAEYMNNKGKIYAFDLYEQRANLIKSGASRLGIDIIEAESADASILNEALTEKADRVLCDVPCSCLGTLCRKPEIKYKDFGFIDKLCELQYNILINSAKYLVHGGVLVYSTCSLSVQENDRVCDRFLKENSEFEKLEDYITLLPHKGDSDGFFIASFRRK